jgi:hypothetical protein
MFEKRWSSDNLLAKTSTLIQYIILKAVPEAVPDALPGTFNGP